MGFKIINLLKNLLIDLIRNPKLFYYEFLSLLYKIINKKKDIYLYISDELWIFIPLDINAIWGIKEVFYDNQYKLLSWCQHVLDLWWYLWESALYLSIFNKKVTTYEPNPVNTKYIKENCKKNNIEYIPKWVSWNKSEQNKWFIFQGHDLWWHSCNKKIATHLIDLDFIWNIDSNYDWIKIDIEWWEYDIIKYYMNITKMFNYKAGYIEFHNIKENKEVIKDFLSFIEEKEYLINFYNTASNEITQDLFFKKDVWLIFFKKNIH